MDQKLPLEKNERKIIQLANSKLANSAIKNITQFQIGTSTIDTLIYYFSRYF